MHDPNNTHGVVYQMNKTKSGHFTNLRNDFDLSYGSAELDGIRNQDIVCLRPFPSNFSYENDIPDDIMKSHFCVRDIRFMTIISSTGMETCDGILGLSPKSYNRHSFLSELKSAGLIKHAIVSFSNNFF